MRARVAPRLAIAERHAPASDMDGERLGRPGEALLGDRAAAGFAVDLVVAARSGRPHPVDGPELPAWPAQDEGRAAVADRQRAVLDLPAHRAAVAGLPLRGEWVGHLPPIGAGSALGLDDHGEKSSG